MASALVLTGATGLEEALASPDRSDYILGGLGELLRASAAANATHRPEAQGEKERRD